MGRRWWGLLAISVAVAMVIVDVTIINVAVPVIIADLGVDATTTQWLQTTYTLTLAGLLIVAGRIGDRFGRRRVLVVGVALFMAGSVLAALAVNGPMLIAGRFVQGLGGAAILPATLSLINAEFRGRERATAFAVWGSTVGGIAAIGPLLGGWLTTELSWRWAFWINLALGTMAIAGVLAAVRESREESTKTGVDPLGVVLGVLTPAALVFGLVEGRVQGWWRPASEESWSLGGYSVVPFVLTLALLSGLAFWGWERHRGRIEAPVLVDLDLFGVPTFARGNIVVVVVALGQIGLLFVLPLWLQSVLGYSALGTGALLVSLAVGAFVAAGSTPALAERWGAAWVLRFGLLAELAALGVLAASLSPDSSAWGLVAVLFVYGFGIGTAEAQLPGVILADVPVDDSGQAAGIQSTAQELGSALGIALLGTVLLTSTTSDLTNRLDAQGLPPDRSESIASVVSTSAGTAIPGLEPNVARAAREAFTHGTTVAAIGGGGALLVGLLVTVTFPARRRGESATGAPPVSLGGVGDV